LARDERDWREKRDVDRSDFHFVSLVPRVSLGYPAINCGKTIYHRMLKKFVQQGRRQIETGGVPSGAHGATNKEHQVCARRRVVRRPGPR